MGLFHLILYVSSQQKLLQSDVLFNITALKGYFEFKITPNVHALKFRRSQLELY